MMNTNSSASGGASGGASSPTPSSSSRATRSAPRAPHPAAATGLDAAMAGCAEAYPHGGMGMRWVARCQRLRQQRKYLSGPFRDRYRNWIAVLVLGAVAVCCSICF
jgi:hypothetical protein